MNFVHSGSGTEPLGSQPAVKRGGATPTRAGSTGSPLASKAMSGTENLKANATIKTGATRPAKGGSYDRCYAGVLKHGTGRSA